MFTMELNFHSLCGIFGIGAILFCLTILLFGLQMHFDLFGQLRAKEAWDALYHGTFSLKYEKLISWDKPKSSFVKLNVDGSAKGQPGVAVAGGINRDENGVWLAGFAYNIGNFFFTHSRNTGFVSRVEVMLEYGSSKNTS